MTTNIAWFFVLGAMLIGYAILDGFDLGVGALHLLLGKTRKERETAITAIGPVWNGNEVWLIASGGAMVAAFPHLYATSFSGFYLALMLVLWLLILRGVGIEFRHQIHHPMWEDAWDAVFSVSSALLAVLFGVAVGNVLRGVPLDAAGRFQGTFALLLNPFSILAGVLSLTVLCQHGAAFMAMKTEGSLQLRARRFVGGLWYVSVALMAAITGASFVVRPDFLANYKSAPVLFLIPLASFAAIISVKLFVGRGNDRGTFLASSTFIGSVLLTVAAGLFPTLLPALPGSAGKSLDIYNSASPHHSQAVALGVYLFGMALVIVYLVNIYRVWGGKVREGQAYGA